MQFMSHDVSHSGEKERKKISNKENSHKVILHFLVDIYIHGCNSYSLEDKKIILLRKWQYTTSGIVIVWIMIIFQ